MMIFSRNKFLRDFLVRANTAWNVYRQFQLFTELLVRMGRYLLMSSTTWNTFSLMTVLVVRTLM